MAGADSRRRVFVLPVTMSLTGATATCSCVIQDRFSCAATVSSRIAIYGRFVTGHHCVGTQYDGCCDIAYFCTRVGSGASTMFAIICVATIDSLPCLRHRAMILRWTIGTIRHRLRPLGRRKVNHDAVAGSHDCFECIVFYCGLCLNPWQQSVQLNPLYKYLA